jgi:hypothetical protein
LTAASCTPCEQPRAVSLTDLELLDRAFQRGLLVGGEDVPDKSPPAGLFTRMISQRASFERGRGEAEVLRKTRASYSPIDRALVTHD